ncbi:MAG: hypothetical protein GXN98_02375, partial [Euryarchaeota archaeon]|nr:hypothetical protein [Euryarchaeota archaeon]
VVDVWVNGVQVVSGATSSSAYWDHEVDITPYLRPGENVLAIFLSDSGCYYNYLDAEVVVTLTGAVNELNYSYGDRVTLNATVMNTGKGNLSGSIKVGYYINGTSVSSGSVSTLLPAGGSVNVLSTWLVTPGNHTLLARVDPGNVYIERNEGNNELSFALSPVPYPDLIVESLTTSPRRFEVGERVTLIATLKNNGTGISPLGAFYSAFYIDGSMVCTAYSYATLYPGGSINVSCAWTAQAGDHNLSVKADYYNHIAESNETNNQLEKPLPRVPYPDLVISNLSWSPATFNAGDSVNLYAELKNVGEGNISSGPIYVGFYINGRLLGTPSIRTGLGVNQSATLAWTWKAEAGNHTFSAVADPFSYILEENENNNLLSAQLPPTPYPDLVVEDIFLPISSNTSYGESVKISALVKNTGKGNFSGCFTTRFYIDGAPVGESQRCGIEANTSFNATADWMVQPGNHTVRVVADAYNTVAEERESNNERTESFSVTVLYPDFVVSDVMVYPPPTMHGQKTGINVTVTNLGPGDLSGGQISVMVYMDGAPLGQEWVYGGLRINETKSILVPWVASGGNHTIRVVVDSDNRIRESREDNNEFTSNVSYQLVPPDLTVSAVYLSNPNPVAEEYVQIHANITNLGGGSGSCVSVSFYLDGKFIGSVSQKVACGIQAGQTLVASWPWYAKPGVHTIQAVVDPDNVISELNETNNRLSTTTGNIPAGDLVVSYITYSPAQGVQYGDGVRIVAGIKNNGTVDIPADVHVRFVVNGAGYADVISGGIKAGETKNASVTWRAVPGGNFSVSVMADYVQRISEISESNNRLDSVLGFSVPYPDLVIGNITWSPASGIRDGDTVLFNVTVSNVGAGRSPATGSLLQVGSYQLGFVVPPLDAGATTSVLVRWAAKVGTNFSVVGFVDVYGSVVESNESNNMLNAGAVADVLPVEKFSVSFTPSITLGVGESGVYTIKINNYGSASSNYSINVSGIDSGWYTLERETIYLAPGEVGSVKLNITLPSNCSIAGITKQFSVRVTSLFTNTSLATATDLNIDPGYTISNLFPLNNTRTGATDLSVTWRTLTNTTPRVYIRAEGSASWSTFSAPSGYLHNVVVGNLSRNTWYEFYVESSNACGSGMSGIRRIYIDNGVSFLHKSYTFNINRDYNQRGLIYIKNTDTVPHRVKVQVVNPYDDLIVGFVGPGSVDSPVTVNPGQTAALDFRMHAQDAEREYYELVLNLTGYDYNGSLADISDFATVRINVRFPVVNFTVEEIDSDPLTLRKTFRITNHGDTITDLRVRVDDTIKEKVLFEPAIEHGNLVAGGSITFTMIPLLEVGSTGFNGTLFVSGAGKEINTSVDFRTPPGERIFAASYPIKTINFSSIYDSDGSNLTNPPDGAVVPALVVNGTAMFMGDVIVEVRQNGEPVVGTNVSLTVTSSNGSMVLYGISDPFGLVYFKISGPVGNYSYRAEIVGYNTSTEKRSFTVSAENASIVDIAIEWVEVGDLNSSFAGELDSFTLDSAPFYFIANVTNPLLNATPIMVLEWDVLPSQRVYLSGELNGSTLVFTATSIPPANYTAYILLVSDNAVQVSMPKNISVTDYSLANLKDMTIVRNFKLNESDGNVTTLSIVAKRAEGDPRKNIVLTDIELNEERTAFIYHFVLTANETSIRSLYGSKTRTALWCTTGRSPSSSSPTSPLRLT